ncbi:MAG: FHA domain-containing protein [Pyrinomonadaceae bacterium MAG19_C2-C3]|nr:FHA domain-containing protein [Pyrinomonadaceae bacterium MAG19_C2-C3]
MIVVEKVVGFLMHGRFAVAAFELQSVTRAEGFYGRNEAFMIDCPTCRIANADDAQYCDECGGGLQSNHAHAASQAVQAINIPTAAQTSMNQISPHTTGNLNDAVAPAVHAGAGKSSRLPHARLVVVRGESAGKEFFLREDETHIGRWDADGGIFPDVDLDADDREAKVSRRHARIVRSADGYTIEDLGSTNGTFVNRGRRLLPGQAQPLTDKDEIIVGKMFLRLHLL